MGEVMTVTKCNRYNGNVKQYFTYRHYPTKKDMEEKLESKKIAQGKTDS